MNTTILASEKTLRDEFAGQALAGFMARPSLVGINVAVCCYEQADSMMDERLRREAVVKQSSTTDHSPDAGKMAELQAANRELVEALEVAVRWIPSWYDVPSVANARAILAKHKGAK